MWIIYFNNAACFWLLCNEVYRVGKHNCHVTIQNDKSISRTHLTIQVGSCSKLLHEQNQQSKTRRVHQVEEWQREHITSNQCVKQGQKIIQCSAQLSCQALQQLFNDNCVPPITLTDSSTYGTIVSFNSSGQHCSTSNKCSLSNKQQFNMRKKTCHLKRSAHSEFVDHVSVASSLLASNLIGARASSSHKNNNKANSHKDAQLIKTRQSSTVFDDNNIHNRYSNNNNDDNDAHYVDKDDTMRKRLSSMAQWNTLTTASQLTQQHHLPQKQSLQLNSSVQHMDHQNDCINNKKQMLNNTHQVQNYNVNRKLIKGEPFVVPCNARQQQRSFRITLGKHNAQLTLAWLNTFVLAQLIQDEVALKFRHALQQCGAQMRLPLTHVLFEQGTINDVVVTNSVDAVLRQIELIASAHYYVTSMLTPTPLAIAMLCRNIPIVQPSFFIAIRDRHSPQQPLPDSASHLPPVSSEWQDLMHQHNRKTIIQYDTHNDNNNNNDQNGVDDDSNRDMKNSLMRQSNHQHKQKQWISNQQIPNLLHIKQSSMHQMANLLFKPDQPDANVQRSNLFTGITFVVVQLSLFVQVAQYLPFTGAHVIYDDAIEDVLCGNVQTTTITTKAAEDAMKLSTKRITTATKSTSDILLSIIDVLKAMYMKYSKQHVLVYRTANANQQVLSCLKCLCQCLKISHMDEYELIQHLLSIEHLPTLKQAALAQKQSKLNVESAIAKYIKQDNTFAANVTNDSYNNISSDNFESNSQRANARQNTLAQGTNAKIVQGQLGRDSCGNGRKTHAAPLFPQFQQRTEMLYRSLRQNTTRLQQCADDCQHNGKSSKYKLQRKRSTCFPVLEWIKHPSVNCVRDGTCDQRRRVNAAGWVSWHSAGENDQNITNEQSASSLPLEQQQQQQQQQQQLTSMQITPSLPPYPCFLSYLQNDQGDGHVDNESNKPRHFVKQKWLACNGVVQMIRDNFAENDIEASKHGFPSNKHITTATSSTSRSGHRYVRTIPRVDADNIVPDVMNQYHFQNMQSTSQIFNTNANVCNRNDNIIGQHNSNHNSNSIHNMSTSESLAPSFNAFDVAVHHSTTKSRKRIRRTEQRVSHKNCTSDIESVNEAANRLRCKRENTKRKTSLTTYKQDSNNNFVDVPESSNKFSNNNNNRNDSALKNDSKYNNDDLYELFGI